MARLIVRDHETNSTIAHKTIDLRVLPSRLTWRDTMLRDMALKLAANSRTTHADQDLWYVLVEDNKALAKGQL